jgi:hypothetical protein
MPSTTSVDHFFTIIPVDWHGWLNDLAGIGIRCSPVEHSPALYPSPCRARYVYVRKTNRNWSDECRQLVLRLSDGNEYRAWSEFR